MNHEPTWNLRQWQRVRELRDGFLGARQGLGDYWTGEEDCRLYDATLGQRVRWKLMAVIDILKKRQWRPPAGTWMDWGCGTGMAISAILEGWPDIRPARLILSDRSGIALRYAAARLIADHPTLKYSLELTGGTGSKPTGPAGGLDLLAVSHVWNELTPPDLERLENLLRQARAAIWVEPGAIEPAQALTGIRERWRNCFRIVAPCPHQSACGLLSPAHARDWCHFFTPPPTEIHTESFWAKCAAELGFDKRLIPFSFLVMDRPTPDDSLIPARQICLGRPRSYKAWHTVQLCEESGISTVEAHRRDQPDLFRVLNKGFLPHSIDWAVQNGRVIDVISPLPEK